MSTQAIDQTRLGRLRWRARRGLLENDLVLQRYFEVHGAQLTEQSIAELDELLELPDNELLDLILNRSEPGGGDKRTVLDQLRSVQLMTLDA